MQRAANVHELVERESDLAPDAAAVLSVSVVGRLTLRFKGRLIELRTQKAGAVLSYLALSETKHESRERLVGLLWSRSDEERARASLPSTTVARSRATASWATSSSRPAAP